MADTQRLLPNGPLTNGQPKRPNEGKIDDDLEQWNKNLKMASNYSQFHGDLLLADKHRKQTGLLNDISRLLTLKNLPDILRVASVALRGKGLDKVGGAPLIASLSNDSKKRAGVIQSQVQAKFDAMLHPPVTYLGDAFQYRAPDGKFNSVIHPHLGAAGAPYAKTVPSQTHPLGALPDPGDIFDRLMAREPKGRDSPSGLSSMLIYHATIIIHDIFRTNESDKNLSDSSSYLDLSPLYGYNIDMQRKVRDGKFKQGLLKPDTFAEDRLLRQPPGVCIMLVMYNRYHNYAARQLRRINENGRFSVPRKFEKPNVWYAAASAPDIVPEQTKALKTALESWRKTWNKWVQQGLKPVETGNGIDQDGFDKASESIKAAVYKASKSKEGTDQFVGSYEAVWDKLDDDLFNTARLITCGLYINVSIHDYLRALMGMHQFDTNFTLDPRGAMDHRNVSRGLGNQVTVEFNLLYRFHCAISRRDEKYTEDFMKEAFAEMQPAKSTSKEAKTPAADPKQAPKASKQGSLDIKNLSIGQFGALAAQLKKGEATDPWSAEFGLKDDKERSFKRNTITGLFDDEKMIRQLKESMDDPISNFGPLNTPRCLKNVEIMGIHQARKWEIGTLNDFRDFFGMKRHRTFEEISGNEEVQNALRDLYDHPDKVELYPGIFCESDANKGDDPGPSEVDSALWAAIFSDAITLVRSDRFYTVDWNTNSLTSWGMKEVSPDYDNLKTSVFHRLLQRAFPEWFPYDSIRFFHPFYTAEKNAQYAQEQGYYSNFSLGTPNFDSAHSKLVYPASEPAKPPKPISLTTYGDIETVLNTGADEIIHPAFSNAENLPGKMHEALQSIRKKGTTPKGEGDRPERAEEERAAMTKAYFAHQMRAIIKREIITMRSAGQEPIYQIDVTRDLAIPVVTRCIADFLGFSELIRDEGNPHAKYSENEIYQHITNCQTFLSYNADETKLLQRRTNFKNSIIFLLKLAEEGNVLKARQWWVRVMKGVPATVKSLPRTVTDAVGNMFKARVPRDEKDISAGMREWGKRVAVTILKEVGDSGKAAAVLLLTALDLAHIEVLAFTATLDHLLDGAYKGAKDKKKDEDVEWFQLQKSLFPEDGDVDEQLFENKVLEAQKASVKLPFIRKVVKDVTIKLNGEEQSLKKGQVIICDIYQAMNPTDPKKAKEIANLPHLNYKSSLSAGLVSFNPKDIAVHALTAMIKVTAQLKNLRRGHTNQGTVKRIEIDQTYEGYANFMAQGRMWMIEHDAEDAGKHLQRYKNGEKTKKEGELKGEEEEKYRELLEQRKKDAKRVFSATVLKPKQDTYLTAEWDEMVPFPTTWKLRFEGYGPSTYGGPDRPKLLPDFLPDDRPPFYQPQGPSHFGGSFADAAATGGKSATTVLAERLKAEAKAKGGEDTAAEQKKAEEEGKKREEEKEREEDKGDKGEKVKKGEREWPNGFPCDWVDVKTKGCGAPAPVLHSTSEEVGKVAIEGVKGAGGR